MTLEAIYFIGQTVAAVALVISLIFVGIQIRQNTAQSKVQAAEASHWALVEWQASMTPELAAIAVKANTDPDSLSAEESFLVGTTVTRLMQSMQEAHAKWLEGSLVDNRWMVWDQYAEYTVSPGIVRIWQQRRSMFSDEFQSFYDEKIEKGARLDRQATTQSA